jgi:glutamine---fructose-6-phosphate transaminase (isomerizing)
MCGIIGITGRDDAVDGIVDGLTRLEYRGYDSAGIVVSEANGSADLKVVKRAGKLDNLTSALQTRRPVAGRAGIGHTRWATHGAPNDTQRPPAPEPHGPRRGGAQRHPRELPVAARVARRCDLRSDTDTEVAAHLVEVSSTRWTPRTC